MTRKPRKQHVRPGEQKPEDLRGAQPTRANTRIAAQMRKILRTHYASKYRVR